MASKLSLYQLSSGSAGWAFDLLASSSSGSLFKREYRLYRVIDLAGQKVLAAFSKDQPEVDLYRLLAEVPWFSFAATVQVDPSTAAETLLRKNLDTLLALHPT